MVRVLFATTTLPGTDLHWILGTPIIAIEGSIVVGVNIGDATAALTRCDL